MIHIRKKMLLAFSVSAVIGLGVAPSAALADGAALAKKYNCLVCHSVDKKRVGPAYKAVAARYEGDPSAVADLVEKIKKGGKGAWGSVPMPPNKKVTDEVATTILDWVLGLNTGTVVAANVSD
jgi:cytochrome c